MTYYPDTNECPLCGDMKPHPDAKYCGGRKCLWSPRRKKDQERD